MPGFWKLSEDNDKGCQPCNCSEKGSEEGSFCDQLSGKCQCKANVEGHNCDQCKSNYWNLSDNVNGCEQCDCSDFGRNGTECNAQNGTCQCQENYGGPQCYECANGYHSYPTCDGNYQHRKLVNQRKCTCGKTLESSIDCKNEFINGKKRIVCKGSSLRNRLIDCNDDAIDECQPDQDSSCSESTCLKTLLDEMSTSTSQECGIQLCSFKGM